MSKAVVLSDKVFEKFMVDHLRLTTYSIAIKKCEVDECPFHGSVIIPPNIYNDIHFLPTPTLISSEKYKEFEDVYGTEPSEKDRPSLTRITTYNLLNKADFQLQFTKARMVVKCRECYFPRLLNTRKKLQPNAEFKMKDYLPRHYYICETEVPEMFQPKKFDCGDPISPHYFQLGTKLEGYEPVCTFCLKKEELEAVKKQKF